MQAIARYGQQAFEAVWRRFRQPATVRPARDTVSRAQRRNGLNSGRSNSLTVQRRGLSSAGVRKATSPPRSNSSIARVSRPIREGRTSRNHVPAPDGRRYLELLESLTANLAQYQDAKSEVAALNALVEHRAKARESLFARSSAVQKDVDKLLEAMHAEGKSKSLLPEHLVAGLLKYEDLAKKACKTAVDSLHPERSDLHLLDQEILMAQARLQRRPTEPTRNLIAKLERRRKELVERNAKRQPFLDAFEAHTTSLQAGTNKAIKSMINNLPTARQGHDPRAADSYGVLSDVNEGRRPAPELSQEELEDLKARWRDIQKALSMRIYLHRYKHESYLDSYNEWVRETGHQVPPYQFNDKYFKESQELFHKLGDTERRFVLIRDEAMRAGLAPIMILNKFDLAPGATCPRLRIDPDLGEFLEHLEDGEVETCGPTEQGIKRHNKELQKPRIHRWMRNISDALDPDDVDIESRLSEQDWELSSVGLGDSRSVINHEDGLNEGDGLTKARRRRIQEHHETGEALRERFWHAEGA